MHGNQRPTVFPLASHGRMGNASKATFLNAVTDEALALFGAMFPPSDF